MKGAALVGPLPKEIQNTTTYAVALSASTKNKDAAAALIKTLSGPAAAAVLKSKGMEQAQWTLPFDVKNGGPGVFRGFARPPHHHHRAGRREIFPWGTSFYFPAVLAGPIVATRLVARLGGRRHVDWVSWSPG